jgi:hypothetical protein
MESTVLGTAGSTAAGPAYIHADAVKAAKIESFASTFLEEFTSLIVAACAVRLQSGQRREVGFKVRIVARLPGAK